MRLVGAHQGRYRATSVEVADLELRGTWGVDVRRHPRPAERAGWLLEWEDDIANRSNRAWPTPPTSGGAADEASELVWPLDAA